MAFSSSIISSAIKGLDGTGTVHQRTVSTTRNSNTNIRDIGRITLMLLQVGLHIIVADLDVVKEIRQSSLRLLTTLLKPIGLIG